MKILLFLITTVFYKWNVSGCTIPTALIGTWTSSDKGSITLTSTGLSNYAIYNKGGQTFTCFDQTGDYYSFQTSSIGLFSSTAVAALCIEFQYVTTGMYKYVIKTSQLSQADNERFMYVAPGTTLTSSLVCNDTSNTDFHFLFDPSLDPSSFAKDCPSFLQGQMSYVSNITTPGECNGTGSLDVCTDTKKMTFNYTSCSTVQAYSSGGELYCLYTESSGTYYKVMLYNTDATVDDSTTYRFTCYLVDVNSDGNIYGTQYPKSCYAGQTPTLVSDDGGYIIFHQDSSCDDDSTTSSGLTAAASAGIVIAVLLIFIILVLIIAFCIWKHNKKVEPHVPDQGVAPAETKMPAEQRRPDLVRNTKAGKIFHTSNDMPDIEAQEKVPRFQREVTQNSMLRGQIITPSVVNPMMREWTDLDDSDDLTLIGTESMRAQLDPPTAFGSPLTPVEESSRYMGFLTEPDYSGHERSPKKKKKKKVKKKKKKK